MIDETAIHVLENMTFTFVNWLFDMTEKVCVKLPRAKKSRKGRKQCLRR